MSSPSVEVVPEISPYEETNFRSSPSHIACVAVFSVSFQASGSRVRQVAKVTKKLVPGGRGREGKEKPAAELRHFTERTNCFRSLGTSTVTSTVTRDPIILHPTTQSFYRFSVASISKYKFPRTQVFKRSFGKRIRCQTLSEGSKRTDN